jgi:signal peptidase I
MATLVRGVLGGMILYPVLDTMFSNWRAEMVFVIGRSMSPTIVEGDKLSVCCLNRNRFTSVALPACQGSDRHSHLNNVNKDEWSLSWFLSSFLAPSRSIRRGDVVTIRSPANASIDLIKRVIALPGDLVVLRRGAVWWLPRGHIWVEGDNKLNSHDSNQFGPVPVALIKGRVVDRHRYVPYMSERRPSYMYADCDALLHHGPDYLDTFEQNGVLEQDRDRVLTSPLPPPRLNLWRVRHNMPPPTDFFDRSHFQ